ncbi:thrombomodulin [Poeciliopsis prolifica]|uniref:thrombomodulin n=1 Tax=Poeciliopsis prolifica TaxID=188132 RepID=UPI00241378CA|nr:thrombomodulin [Poeciliopsis prolifica]
MLFVSMLVFLLGKDAGAERNSGYCIGNACFTLFRGTSTFSSGQRICRDQGSHLMTVRTSVSSDVLSVLLGNLTGSFWIGLHRLSGCPDPSEELRGFQWVTKDAESDFVNWLPDPDDSCSAARCVSVSGEENFRWSETPCDHQAAGFLCENSFTDPCANLPHTAQQTVLYLTPYGFEVEDMQSSTLPSGTIATLFPSEAKYICGTSNKWLRAPWSCEIEEGGCEYQCAANPSNKPICYCPPGETLSPTNGISCQAEGAGDPCAALRCQQTCYEAAGRHHCGCDHGLQLAADGRTCVDFDECTDERQCPEENSECVNTLGGYTCACQPGYRSVGGKCVDTDECMLAPCEHECTNTPGSYVCSCFKGFTVVEGDPHKCSRYCGQQECPAECDPNDKNQCFCPNGYLLDVDERGSAFCIDIDECESNFCEQGCTNTYGGYACSCPPGFTLVGEHQCKESTSIPPTDAGGLWGGSPTQPGPHPDPTRRPSAVTPGGLAGIIVSTVFVVLLAVIAAHVLLLRRGKKEESAAGATKEREEETHGLQGLSDKAV